MVNAAINVLPTAPVRRLIDLAVRAENRGFSRCWVYDEGIIGRDVYVALTAIALATSKLHVGPGITNPYTRHPAATISAIATLDELSEGRAYLGIGAGGSLTLDAIGLARTRPLTAVRETIEASRRLFSGEVVDLEGTSLQLRQAHCGYGRSDTEIWLAGRGPKMLQLGARTCDGLMLDFIYKPDLMEMIAKIRTEAAGAGNSPRISYSTLLITSQESMAAAKRHLSYRLVDSPRHVQEEIGLDESSAAALREALSRGLDAAGELVRDEWVEPFALVGSPAECSRELRDLFDAAQIDEFLLPILDFQSAERDIDVAAQVLEL